MYSWLDSWMRRQLVGVDHPERIVALNGTTKVRRDFGTSYPDFVDYRERRPASVADLIAYTLAPMNLRTGGDPQRVFGELVSGNYFDMLGVQAGADARFALTRTRHPIARPLSCSVTTSGSAGSRRPVDRRSTDHAEWTRIHSHWRCQARISWHRTVPESRPVGPDDDAGSGDGRRSSSMRAGLHWLQVMVRLKPGVSLSRAEADLGVVAPRLQRPTRNRRSTASSCTSCGARRAWAARRLRPSWGCNSASRASCC